MRNDYGIAAMLLLLYAFFYLCYMNLEGRQGEGAGNTNEPRPVSSLVSEDSPCKCRTSLRPQITDAPTIPLQETTCSEYSYLRGGKQKVVSFSFYERSKNSSVQRILSGKVEGNVFLEGLAIKTLHGFSIKSNCHFNASGKIWGGQGPPWNPQFRQTRILF